MSSEALERATTKLRLRDSLGGAAPALLTSEEADALLAEVARLEQERDDLEGELADFGESRPGRLARAEAALAVAREQALERDAAFGEVEAAASRALAALAVAREREQRARRHHTVALDVAEFHQALDIPIGDTPAIRRPELRAELIREEAKEAVGAIERGDLIEALDGLCDLLCVTYGAALEFGVNLAPIWDEVHRTNMAKAGGPVRADGKRLKPAGWTPPDIGAALARAALVDEPAADTLCECGHPFRPTHHTPGTECALYGCDCSRFRAAATLAEPGRSRRDPPAVVDGEASLPGSASAAADEPGETP